jgi:hypothetical protein
LHDRLSHRELGQLEAGFGNDDRVVALVALAILLVGLRLDDSRRSRW